MSEKTKGHRLMAGALRSLGEDLEIGGGSAATFGHELIELGLVLGHAKTCQEVLKLPLLFLEPVQGLGAIVVERLVAARACRVPPGPPTSHLVHACLPAAKSVVEDRHASTPDHERQGRKPNGPPHHEAEDHKCDPCRPSQIIDLCKYGHAEPRVRMLITFTFLVLGRRGVKDWYFQGAG